MALQYFCLNRWTFINEKTMGLRKLLLPSDVDAFSFTEDVEPFQFFLSATLGGRRYLLKEGDDTLDRAKTHSSRMWVASKLCNFLWDLALFWFIFVKIDIISVMTNMYGRWYLYFAE
ncbi:unnamed protein product [Tenebrio molitor]|nr:unnamed protein product [Tenebrio molitor]